LGGYNRRMAGSKEDKKQEHHREHRKRLRARFMRGGAEALADYELLELILFRAIPQRDVKPLAKTLIAEFGSLAQVLSAPAERLTEVDGVGDACAVELKIVQAASLALTRAQVLKRPAISSWQALLDYCTASMAHDQNEQFRILFLDKKNVLIADEIQQKGTVDHTPVYPREVVKRALALGASAIILVHNHPSGDPTPSRGDIEMTKLIAKAGDGVGIRIHDHLVIGRGSHASFKSLGLL